MSKEICVSNDDLIETVNSLMKNMSYVLDELKLGQAEIAKASLDEDGKGLSQRNVSNLKNANKYNPTLSTIFYGARGLSNILGINITIEDMLAPEGVKNRVEGRNRYEKLLQDSIRTLANVQELDGKQIDQLFDGLDLLRVENISLTMELLSKAQKNGDLPSAIIKLNELNKAS